MQQKLFLIVITFSVTTCRNEDIFIVPSVEFVKAEHKTDIMLLIKIGQTLEIGLMESEELKPGDKLRQDEVVQSLSLSQWLLSCLLLSIFSKGTADELERFFLLLFSATSCDPLLLFAVATRQSYSGETIRCSSR